MKKIDKILITNDDGYYAKGIKVLKKVLNKYVDEVYTVAPSKNQSGSGRSITLGSSINYTKVSKFDWVIDGTPVDAMIFALNNLFKNDKPDYIFSGINSGSNIGDEISYSGTVGAAFEGALRGVRSLAISQSGSFNDINKFAIAEKYMPYILNNMSQIFKKKNTLFNINFPSCEIKKVKKMMFTESSHQKLSDKLIFNPSDNSFKIGNMNIDDNQGLKTDFYAINNNYISVTPISVNSTCREYFN